VNLILMRTLMLTAVAGAMLAAGPATGAYPEKPLRMIVPFSTGGGADIQGRLLAEKMRQSLGQQVLVDNRTGAGGVVGVEAVVQAPPDGYTMLFTTATIAVNATLFKDRMKFDTLRDLEPLSWVSSAPLVLVVHPSVPAKTVPDLVALAKRTAKGLNAGGNAAGSTSHLSGEMFKQMIKAPLEIILYKGGGPATLGVATGEIDLLFATAPSAMPHIKSSRIRALAVTTAKKASVLPNLPTMNSFLPGFESDNWYAMFMPAKTPKAVISKINDEVKNGMRAKEIADFMAREGLDLVASTPEELTVLLKREIAKYAEVIKRGNIKSY